MPQKVYSIRIMLDMLSNHRLYRKMNEDSWRMLCEDMCRCAATSTSKSNDLDVNLIKEKCMKSLDLRFINQFAACTLVLYLSEIYPEHCESLLMLTAVELQKPKVNVSLYQSGLLESSELLIRARKIALHDENATFICVTAPHRSQLRLFHGQRVLMVFYGL